MTPERFAALADAFGADLRRWPEADRNAAQALVQESTLARARLAEADALDALLDLSRIAAPSADLRQRILATAPKPRATGPASARSRLLRWLSGLGAIGILTCGAVAGAAVVAVSGPSHVDADSLAGLYDQTNSLDVGGA
jgi:hypothetical protein